MQTKKLVFGEILRKTLDESRFHRNKKNFCDSVGISASTLTQYMKMKNSPSFEKLIKISEVLDVSLDYLVWGKSESTSKEYSDIGPIAKYIDISISDLQMKSINTHVMVSKISELLADKIKITAEELINKINDEKYLNMPLGGFITDNETAIIEKYSKKSDILSTNLHYDIISIPDGEPAAGKFLDIVAQNINKGYEYRFILPDQHDKNWKDTIKDFKALLHKRCSQQDVTTKCEFAIIECEIISGFGVYTLLPQLKLDHPFLFQRIEPFIHQDNLGYVIPPSNDPKSDLLMDSYHLKTAKQVFNNLWKIRNKT